MTTQLREDAPSFSALIIDNNVASRQAIARFLERDGWRVTTAGDAVEGLEAVRGHRFDVVITDVRMHERGGLSLLEQVLELRPELWDKVVFIRPDLPIERPSDDAVLNASVALAALRSELHRIVRKANGNGKVTP